MSLKKTKTRFRDTGESSVWLMSIGLTAGIIMVVILIGLILYKGSEFFWPKKVALIEYHNDQKTEILAGEFVKEVVSKKDHHEELEWQLFLGNRDILGHSYKFIHKKDIQKITYPNDILSIERREYGDALAFPVAIESKNTLIVQSSDSKFNQKLKELMQQAQNRWAKIHEMERVQIGKINRQIESLRLEKKSYKDKTKYKDRIQKIDAKIMTLQNQYEDIAKVSRKLRKEQEDTSLKYKLANGKEKSVVFGDIVSFYYPNQLSFMQRVGTFFHNFYRFLIEEPREANTEGGIFPAIFGTFVMTILMSVVVMPFGVLAAIYLREYAKQGFFVRVVRICVNNLAGVPSIVFGVFGLGFFVYFVGGTIDQLFFSNKLPTPTFGTGGILWASLTLALMTVPVVIVATEEALASVPGGFREGSLALGASKWQTIQRVILPAAAPGILTGLILAMARGAGEVAPLMLVGVVKLAPNLPIDAIFPYVHLDYKFMHLGFHIYDLGFQSPDSEAAKPMVFATTLVLILLVLLLNGFAIYMREKLRKKYATKAF